MAIRKEKEEICGRLSTRVVYITEDGKRFSQESEAFLYLNGSRRPGKWASDVLMAGITAKASRHWRPL